MSKTVHTYMALLINPISIHESILYTYKYERVGGEDTSVRARLSVLTSLQVLSYMNRISRGFLISRGF